MWRRYGHKLTTMPRPKGRNGKPKKLYLNETITEDADKLAFRRNQSLSDLVEEALKRELKRAAKRDSHAVAAA